MKIITAYCLTLLATIFSTTALDAQVPTLDNQTRIRTKLLRGFCRYVVQTPESGWQTEKLRSFLAVSDSALMAGTRQNRILFSALAAMKKEIQDQDLNRYNAVAWLRFAPQESLPRMVWEAEPVTQLMGHPLEDTGREAELAQGRRQAANTLVVFLKTRPDEPLRYVLFDEKSGKIASWILINQGGLHYFLFL